jgi:enterochelin esterase-like enzyme
MFWRVNSRKRKDLWAAAFGGCKRWLIPILFIVLAIQCVSPPRDDSAPTASPTQKPTTIPTLSAVDLYEELSVRVVDRSWTVEELLTRRELEQSAVWADGEELTFFYQGEAEAVRICCGIQLPMQRVGDSGFWALTVRVDELSQAVISYSFIPYQDGRPIEAEERIDDAQVWRGPDAPSAPERAESLQGQISRYVIDSTALGEPRDLTVYLPPGHDPIQQYPVVYAADGDSVGRFASILDPQIVDGSVPAVIVVGVHSAEYGGTTAFYDPSQDLRAQEYLLGENQERFEAHERFFVYEVSDWAEQTLGASSNREERAVFGYSNGGGFAVSMGIRHPERYGAVLAFSLGVGQDGWGTPEWTADTAPRHYLVAGTLEPFQETTARWAARLTRIGVEHVHCERVCGHDVVMWEEEFPGAVVWAFRDQ